MHLLLRFVRHAARAVLLGSVTLGLDRAASAQSIEAIPGWFLHPYSVRNPAKPFASAPPPRSAATQPAAEPELRDYSTLGGAVQMEAPRQRFDGTFTRPRILIGVPSESMRDWMNAAGVPAEQCLLPMLKARARVNVDGEPSGTMWLYARCTFQ